MVLICRFYGIGLKDDPTKNYAKKNIYLKQKPPRSHVDQGSFGVFFRREKFQVMFIFIE